MNERAKKLSEQYFEGKMGIASGYAQFDDKIDLSFDDTVKRADMLMYDQKEQMKK